MSDMSDPYLGSLSTGKRLSRHLDSLATFYIHNEFLIDCLILYLYVRLYVPEAGATGRIIRSVANHCERDASIVTTQEALSEHPLQKGQLGSSGIAKQIRVDHLSDVQTHTGCQSCGNIVGQSSVVVSVDGRIGR